MISTSRRTPCFFKVRGLRYFSEIYASPTIYALSTKPGRSAIGVVRVSGPASQLILTKLSRGKKLPISRFAAVRKLYDPKTNIMLDEALVLLFNGPKSYTGEDLLELHLHGGNAVVKSVLNAVKSLHTPNYPIRYAENGEFSRRAFQNGRFDLTEIEGIREMIDAETESQRVGALSSMRGETKELFDKWRSDIVNNVALMTTLIDFGEDHDIDEIDELFGTVETNILNLKQEIDRYLVRVQRSEVLMKGIKMTLLGPPNSGKSSLLNLIADREAAIVSEIEGTTRDAIDIPLDINGYKVVIGDTAGIRTISDDKIEAEGIKRAKQRSIAGDLAVLVLPVNIREINEELKQHISKIRDYTKVAVVLNKCDLIDMDDEHETISAFSSLLNIPEKSIKLISCHTGYAIPDLLKHLTSMFKQISATEHEEPVVISQRIQDILANDVLYGFDEFCRYKQKNDVVLATESLRYSIDGIGKITGETVGIEEILGVVFSSFCIGK